MLIILTLYIFLGNHLSDTSRLILHLPGSDRMMTLVYNERKCGGEKPFF